MSSISDKPHLEAREEVCGGKPCIIGTRIRVYDIYVWHQVHGRSADEIVATYPQLSLGDVHAALTYAYDHHDEMLATLQAEDDIVSSLRAKLGPGPLERKLFGDHGAIKALADV